MSTWISVDVEADGPCPGLYSMVSFGAVVIDPRLDKTFYGQTAPISDKYIPQALAVSGHTREEHEAFPKPEIEIARFHTWLDALQAQNKGDRGLVFISDNPAFDWQFINYYLHRYVGKNLFGFSAKRIGDLCAGMEESVYLGNKWKQFRKTRHTHHPVDDAMGVAEGVLGLKRAGLKVPF